MKTGFTRATLAFSAAALAFTGIAAPALAQRDPAYEAARQAGKVGEKPDGYLGIVGGGDATLQKIVNDINIKQEVIYRLAPGAQNTIEENSSIF